MDNPFRPGDHVESRASVTLALVLTLVGCGRAQIAGPDYMPESGGLSSPYSAASGAIASSHQAKNLPPIIRIYAPHRASLNTVTAVVVGVTDPEGELLSARNAMSGIQGSYRVVAVTGHSTLLHLIPTSRGIAHLEATATDSHGNTTTKRVIVRCG